MAIAITRAGGLLLGSLLRTESVSQGDGILFELSVGLYTSATPINPDMVLADFTPVVFTGYAALTAVTFGAPFLDSQNVLQLQSPVNQWVCTADGDPAVAVGYYAWREGTPDVLILADEFDTPITITRAGDGVAFTIAFEVNLTAHGTYLFSP